MPTLQRRKPSLTEDKSEVVRPSLSHDFLTPRPESYEAGSCARTQIE